MTREELRDFLGEDLCPYCPWTNNEVNKPRIGSCEGNYCEEALDAYIDEEGFVIDEYEETDIACTLSRDNGWVQKRRSKKKWR